MNNRDKYLFTIDDDVFCSYLLAKIKKYLGCEQVFIYKVDSQQQLEKTIYPSDNNSQDKTIDSDYQFASENNHNIVKNIIKDSKLKDEDSDDTIPLQTAQLVIPIELKTSEVVIINNNIKLWGILFIYDYNYLREWSEEEKTVVNEIAVQITLAIEKNIVYTKFKELEKTLSIYQFFDQETGLINYSSFLDCLEYEWHNLTRDKNILSLILIQIESNDKLNLALWKEIVEIIQQQIKRPADIVARYDGDKIVAMLPKTDNQGALYVNQQIISQISTLDNNQEYNYQFRSSLITYLPNTEQNYEFLLAKIEKPFTDDLDKCEKVYNQNLV